MNLMVLLHEPKTRGEMMHSLAKDIRRAQTMNQAVYVNVEGWNEGQGVMLQYSSEVANQKSRW